MENEVEIEFHLDCGIIVGDLALRPRPSLIITPMVNLRQNFTTSHEDVHRANLYLGPMTM